MIAAIVLAAASLIAPAAGHYVDPRRCAVADIGEDVNGDRVADLVMRWTLDGGDLVGWSQQEDGVIYMRRGDITRCPDYDEISAGLPN